MYFLTNVTFEDIRDAEDAIYYEDRARCLGRELEVQYAEGDRKSKLLCPRMLFVLVQAALSAILYILWQTSETSLWPSVILVICSNCSLDSPL